MIKKYLLVHIKNIFILHKRHNMLFFLPAGHKDGGRGGRLSKATCSAEGEVGEMTSMTSFQIFSEFGRLDAWSNMGSQDGGFHGGQDHALRMIGLWEPLSLHGHENG